MAEFGDGAVPHHQHSSSSCPAKETAFAGIFTVAGVVAQVSGIICGSISDTFDPRVTVALGGTLVTVGIFLLGFLDPSPDQLYLLPLVYGFLTFGGMTLLFSSFSASFLWRSRQGLILTASNTFFDASAVTPLILLQIYDAGVPRGPLFAGAAAILAAIIVARLVLWFDNVSILQAAKGQGGSGSSRDGASSETTATDIAEPLIVSAEESDGSLPEITPLDDECSPKTVLQSIRSKEFLLLVVFGCVHVFRQVVFLGTNGNLLSNYGDDQAGFIYTKIFSLSLPTGMLYTPLISWLFGAYGWRTVFQACNAIGLAWNLLALIPVLPLQVLTGLVFTCYRALLFSTLVTFCTETFGASTSGRLYGVANLASGVFSSLQYPAVHLTYSLADGDLKYLYAIMAVAVVPLMLLVQTLSNNVPRPPRR